MHAGEDCNANQWKGAVVAFGIGTGPFRVVQYNNCLYGVVRIGLPVKCPLLA